MFDAGQQVSRAVEGARRSSRIREKLAQALTPCGSKLQKTQLDSQQQFMNDSLTCSMLEQCSLNTSEFDRGVSLKTKHDANGVPSTPRQSAGSKKSAATFETPVDKMKSVIKPEHSSRKVSPTAILNRSSRNSKYAEMYKLTPSTADVINALLDGTPLRRRKKTPLRKKQATERESIEPLQSSLRRRSRTPRGTRRSGSVSTRRSGSVSTRRSDSVSTRRSGSFSANSSRNKSDASDLLPPTPDSTAAPSLRVNTPTRLIGGSGLTPKRNKSGAAAAAKTLNLDPAYQSGACDNPLQSSLKLKPKSEAAVIKKKSIDFNISLEVSGLMQALDESSMQLTNEAFTVSDVCASAELFSVFTRELRDKSQFALCVACETRVTSKTNQCDIGGQFTEGVYCC